MNGEQFDTPQLAQRRLARQLLQQHAAKRGFPGESNWARWAFHNAYLDLPRSERPATFTEYVIRELTP